MAWRRARRATGSTPRTGLIPPSSDSSPRTMTPMSRSGVDDPDGGQHPDGDGQVVGGPSLRRSAGARLTVMRWIGKVYPLFLMAA